MQLQWDSLGAYDSTGTPQFRLAESITPNADATEWTVKLRPGVTWSDGDPFTSADVLFTWKFNANPNQSYNSGLWAEVVGHADWIAAGDFSADIAGITAPDDLTVVFALTGPNGAFLNTLLNFRNFILPEHILSPANYTRDLHALDQKEIWSEPYWRAPTVGIGPFLWARTEVDQFIEYNANPTYYMGTPPFEKILMIPISDFAVSAAQLQAGDIDFAQVTLDDQPLLEQAGFTIGTGVAPFPIQSDFNLASSVMSDVRVRQAFMLGCDRQGFVDSFLQGKGVKADSYFFTPWVPKDGIKEYPFDLDAAKALLDAAVADGKFDYAQPVRWLSWNKDARDRQSFIEDCQSKMNQIGVKVEIVNGLEVTNEMAKAGDWELQLYGGYPVQDPNALVQPLACSNIGTEIQENGYAWGGSNYTNYCNAELDALMEEAKTLSDQDARAALYAQAQDIFLEEVPIMINYIGANAFAWASDLQGVTIYGDPSQWAQGIMNWSRAAG